MRRLSRLAISSLTGEQIFLGLMIGFALLIVALLSVWPLWTLFLKVNRPDGIWDFQFMIEVLSRKSVWRAAKATLQLSLLV